MNVLPGGNRAYSRYAGTFLECEMDTNRLAQILGDSCYFFLAANLLWGLYCSILVWRKLKQYSIRREQESHIVEQIQEALTNGDIAAANEITESHDGALARLAALAVENRELDEAPLRRLVAEHMQRDVIGPLENRVSWVLTVIRNGPLLGLMGTVLGMMAAFGRIGMGEKVQPSQIADEISVALICTAMGLGTAIPLGYVASSLSMRIRELQESLTNTLIRLLDGMRGALVR